MCTRLRWLWVVSCIASVLMTAPAAAQSAQERIEGIWQLIARSKFAEASKAVEAALAAPGNDEATLVSLFELAGVAAISSKQGAKGRTWFQKVYSLKPTHKLSGKWPPKVTAAWAEVKKAMAKAGIRELVLEQLTPEIKGGLITAVYVGVENDVFRLGRRVRFHLRPDGGAWTAQEVPVGQQIRAELSCARVEWWAELLGEREALLTRLGSAEKPLADAVPGGRPPAQEVSRPPQKAPPPSAPVAAARPNLIPAPSPAPVEPELVEPAAAPARSVKVVPLVTAGVGLAAIGSGAFFGVKANRERDQIATAKIESGVVTGLTRAQALQLDAQARADSVVANTLLGAGLGLALTGAVLLFVSPDWLP